MLFVWQNFQVNRLFIDSHKPKHDVTKNSVDFLCIQYVCSDTINFNYAVINKKVYLH